ncbi:PAS domain S-box protein [Natronolimnobius sp. AArcel1]|uniref:PAS domain S-box protein n=1 Tax=Natronolimnobius sp. AArcel1 TaxID=1679093 RepID=UPI0013EC28A0|nr:PAS domain S-box protein [Natronolimnobius sp. AArcel1]NGM68447.1 PAS domain S-box protein [Natronolimnobius sp. AArcel1]
MNCVVYADRAPSDDLIAAFVAAGFEPITAETISECHSIHEREPTRLACVVATDSLADGSCIDLCRQFDGASVPVIVCPVDGSEALAGRLLAAGADGYVPRSQAPETLLKRIRDVSTQQQRSLVGPGVDGESHDSAGNEADSPASADPISDDTFLLESQSHDSLESLLESTDADVSLSFTQGETTDRERAGTIVEVVGESVYSLDEAGRFVTVNGTLMAVTGYTRDELVGEHISKILSDASVERRHKRIRALASARGQPDDAVATYEVTLETRTGRQLPCEINAALLGTTGNDEDEMSADVSGDRGTVGIIRDISDRKQMKRELLAHEDKIASLHEVASQLDDCETREEIYDLTVTAAEEVLQFDVCVVDMVEESMLVKKAVSTGVDVEVTQKMSVDKGIAGKTYRTGKTHRVDDLAANPIAQTEDDEYQSVLSVPIGDHGIFQAASSELAAFDHNDEELAELLLSHVTDALERFDFEAELRAERDRFAALFENVPDAAVSTRQRDATSTPIIEAVNPAFEELFGYDEDELLGKPLDTFIVPPEQNAEAATINQQSSQGSVVETEVQRRTADGIRDFMMRVVPIETGDEVGRSVGLYTDITDRKRRRKRLEILNRVLRHDLRNGMNIINGCAEVVADTAEGETADYASVIQERANELIELAEKTRAVERTLERDGSMTAVVDVAAAAERAADAFAYAVDTDSEIDCDLTISLPDQCFVRANHYLETAISEVLENTLEHSDTTSLAVDIQLSPKPDSDGFVTLSISDTGPGIPTEERQLLQEEREITQLRHASGLGLWLVNWAVAQSGGRLTFTDNQPRGTTVTLHLPRADTQAIQYVTEGAADD